MLDWYFLNMLMLLLGFFVVTGILLFLIERVVLLNLILYFLERRERLLWIQLGSPKISDIILPIEPFADIANEDEPPPLKDPVVIKLFKLFRLMRRAQIPFVVIGVVLLVIVTALIPSRPDELFWWPW